MFNLEKQKEKFKNHKATFVNYGNIKILDFQEPGTSNYRIRFLFEEDHYRLHISGDLGELIASNYCNMVYEKFAFDYVNNIGYFKEKIDCHSRNIYMYDEEDARTDLREYLQEHDLVEDILQHDRYEWETDEDKWNEFFENVFENFSQDDGIGSKGYDVISEYVDDVWEFVSDIGRRETGILDLYMLAFKLAQEQLKQSHMPFS